jgi:hypothetical protein
MEPSAWGYNWGTVLGEYKYGDLDLQVRDLESEAVKYGHESRGTRTRE